MRMLFLVDGYNVTMRDPASAGLSKEAQRDQLASRLRTSGKTLLGAGPIVVVFDARALLGRTSEPAGQVTVVYAPDADDEIVRRAAEGRGKVVVVTDDMRLRARISQDVSRRVEYRDSSAVFASAKPVRKDVAARRKKDGDLPTDAEAITKEMKRLFGVDE